MEKDTFTARREITERTERVRVIQGLEFISENISETPCSNCGGEVREFSVPSDIWNAVVRRYRKETNNEYLCVWCFSAACVNWFREFLPVPSRG